jgi:hypothetical protein
MQDFQQIQLEAEEQQQKFQVHQLLMQVVAVALMVQDQVTRLQITQHGQALAVQAAEEMEVVFQVHQIQQKMVHQILVAVVAEVLT